MNRRKAVITAIGSAALLSAQSKKGADETIQLHVDMIVDPAKEKELKKNFKEIFKPAMSKQPGFLHVYMLKLRETKAPPVEMLRRHRVQMAVASDCNPGPSPMASMLTTMNMACTLFRLPPAEAPAWVTIHAARAGGLAGHGLVTRRQRPAHAVRSRA